ncbi:hypothetical protein [Rhizobium gallicum]|uniref:hypothetical protein n=1 Tax=Rhizobium gallicum TaxID=56730 RepID=UPI003AAD6CEE
MFAAADVIGGRQVAAYAACAPEVCMAGAEYVDTGKSLVNSRRGVLSLSDLVGHIWKV